MSSDKPLLPESEPFSTPDPQSLHQRFNSSLSFSSLRCLRRGRSLSSWVSDETQDCDLYHLKEFEKDCCN